LTTGHTYWLTLKSNSALSTAINNASGIVELYLPPWDGGENAGSATWDATLGLLTTGCSGGGGGGNSATTTVFTQYATSTCTTTSGVTTCVSTFPYLHFQDGGDLQYELAWIIFMLTLFFVGFLFNSAKFYG